MKSPDTLLSNFEDSTIKTIPHPKSNNLGAMGREPYFLKVVHSNSRMLRRLVSLHSRYKLLRDVYSQIFHNKMTQSLAPGATRLI
jgi:hypothetical protein